MTTRRLFLQGLAGIAFAARTYSIAAAPLPGRPDLGFSLYGMKKLPLEDALRTCAEIGYSHVEMSLNAGFVTEPAVFSAEARRKAGDQLKQLKLGLPCLMVHLSLVADDQVHANALTSIAEAGRLSQELVPDRPPMLETVLGGSPGKWNEQKSLMAERLRDWADAAERANVSIAIKAHVASAVNSPDRLLWLIGEVRSPAICVAYDYSHFELLGIGMEDSMKLLMPHTKFIHVKDSIGTAEKFQFVLPGEGRTDYVRYFSLLRKFGYSSHVCVEVSSQVSTKPGYDPAAAARKCYDSLANAIDKAHA